MDGVDEKLVPSTKELPSGQGYRLGDYFSACEENRAPFAGRLSRRQPFPQGEGIIVRYDQDVDYGSQEVVRFDSGFGMITSDFDIDEEYVGKMQGDDWFTLQFRTEGESVEVFRDVGQIQGRASRCHITILPRGLEQGSWVNPRTHWNTTLIGLKLPALQQIFSGSMDVLPSDLRSMVDETRSAEFYFNSLPISQEMARALRDLNDSPFGGGIRRLYSEAKSLELVCLALGDMNRLQDEADGSARITLSPKDVERLHGARDLLDANLFSPLTQKRLARQVGLNQTKLARGFREAFGMSVFEYFQYRRMMAARDMISDPSNSIHQVAEILGYAHASSFSKAFRNFFGMPPKSCRR